LKGSTKKPQPKGGRLSVIGVRFRRARAEINQHLARKNKNAGSEKGKEKVVLNGLSGRGPLL